MSKVIQIRDVPDDVHAAIARAAEERGLSLTGYLKLELTQLARRAAVVEHNVGVVRRSQARVGVPVDRAELQAALHEERGEG